MAAGHPPISWRIFSCGHAFAISRVVESSMSCIEWAESICINSVNIWVGNSAEPWFLQDTKGGQHIVIAFVINCLEDRRQGCRQANIKH